VCDLLEVENKQLPVREDAEKGIVKVVGLSEHTVSSYDDVLELLMRGQVSTHTPYPISNTPYPIPLPDPITPVKPTLTKSPP
jgi:hypothetical protein